MPMIPSSTIRKPSVSPVVVRARSLQRFWTALFWLSLLAGVGLLMWTILTHQVKGPQIIGLGVLILVVVSLVNSQVDRTQARGDQAADAHARQLAKALAEEKEGNTPLTLTTEQLAWCQKNPVVRARLAAMQHQRPRGILLKRDMRELIALRMSTLAKDRKHTRAEQGVTA